MITDYMVSYVNGGGGHFLMSVIKRTVLTGSFGYPAMQLGKFNDAHANGRYRNFYSGVGAAGAQQDPSKEFHSIIRVTPGQPCFIPTHYYWPERQFERFPNAKLAVVIHRDEDLLDLSINGFYKTELTEDWHIRQRQTDYTPIYFSPHNVVFDTISRKHPLNFDLEDINLAIRSRICMLIQAGYNFIKPIDDPRVFYIQYRDLVNDPDAVIEFTQRITGLEPTQEVIDEINKYQANQRAFVLKVKQELGL
jgi:hypothetical protein